MCWTNQIWPKSNKLLQTKKKERKMWWKSCEKLLNECAKCTKSIIVYICRTHKYSIGEFLFCIVLLLLICFTFSYSVKIFWYNICSFAFYYWRYSYIHKNNLAIPITQARSACQQWILWNTSITETNQNSALELHGYVMVQRHRT